MQVKTLPLPVSSYLIKWIVIGLSCLSFIIPFSLGHPQFLVGTIVNAALFSSAILLPKKFFWPVIILPSLGVLSRGLIFGPFTPFLIYFLPFIWLGNMGLIFVFKKTFTKVGFSTSVLISSLAKFCLLYISAQIFFSLKIVPNVFLVSMGFNQLLTTISGGIIAFFILNYARRKPRS